MRWFQTRPAAQCSLSPVSPELLISDAVLIYFAQYHCSNRKSSCRMHLDFHRTPLVCHDSTPLLRHHVWCLLRERVCKAMWLLSSYPFVLIKVNSICNYGFYNRCDFSRYYEYVLFKYFNMNCITLPFTLYQPEDNCTEKKKNFGAWHIIFISDWNSYFVKARALVPAILLSNATRINICMRVRQTANI